MSCSGYGYNEQAWDSEYDSTWEEDDEEDEQPKTERASHQYNSQRRAAEDTQNYRHGYPDILPEKCLLPQDALLKPNLLFYQNKIPFKPNGVCIDEMHTRWRDDYAELERNHNFIQWLFPLREKGMNRRATPLTESEIQLMKSDEEVMKRLLESYKLMLGFYGIVLLDPDTGKVDRAKENWMDRFKNLNNNTHNNLRISRILKCLGEMGYEKFQEPLVRFFLKETLCNGNLQNVKQSALDYFMFTVKDKKKRRSLVHFAWVHYKPKNRFIWGPVEKLQRFNPPPEDAEQGVEIDISEELNIPTIPLKNGSSEGYYGEDNEVGRREPENKRERGLVRRTVGYVCRPFLFLFRLLFSSFLAFFRLLFRPFLPFGWLFRPFRYFFRGGMFGFRGEARNEDRPNEEQISAKTEGTRTEKTTADKATVNLSEYKGRSQGFTKSEHKPFLKDPERQKRHKTEPKELNVGADVKTDNRIDESEMKAELETEGNGSKRECIPKGGMGSADKKPLVNIEMPENRQAKEYDNETENEYALINFTKGKNIMKLDEGQTLENYQLEGAEEGSVKEDNDAGNGEVSDVHTKDSGTYNRGGGREHGGTQIANAGNQTEEIKIYIGNSEAEGASKVNLVPLFSGGRDDAGGARIIKIKDHGETSTVWSGDNDGRNIGTQNTLPETDKTDHVERDNDKTEDKEAANVKLSPQFDEVEDEDKNPGINRIEDNRGTLVLGSADNDGGDIGAQNALPETDKTNQFERDDGDTKDEEIANVKLSPQFGGERDASENQGIYGIEGNRGTLVLGSGDNDGGIIGAQNTLPEKDKTDHTERNDGKTKDEEADNVKLSSQFGEEEDDDNPGISKIEGNRRTLVLGSGDNDGGNIGAQNTLSGTDKTDQIESDNGKTENEEVVSVKLSPQFGEEDESLDISKIENNRGALVLGSGGNNGENIEAQITQLEKDKS